MSSSWIDKKQDFKKRLDSISDYFQNTLSSDMGSFTSAMSNYIQKGGVSESSASNGDSKQAMEMYNKIATQKGSFRKLNDDILKTIRTISSTNDSGNLLLQNGILQQDIQALEKKKGIIEKNVKTAIEREKVFRLQNSDINSHQLFLIKNPVPKSFIPYLWAISVLFVAIGVLIFQTTIPPIPQFNPADISTASADLFATIIEFLKDRRIWMSLSGAFAIVIIFLSLKIANIIK